MLANNDNHVDWLTVCLSVLGTLATLMVGLGVYWHTRKNSRKALIYDFSSVRIDKFEKPFRAELQINFRNQPVEDVSLVTINIRNVGKIPIQRDDFDGRLSVSVPKGRISAELQASRNRERPDPTIFAVQKSHSNPRDLPVSAYIEEGQHGNPHTYIFVDPLLLNPGDQFTLVALVGAYSERVSVTGRIAGVNTIENREPPKSPLPFMAKFGLLLIFLACLFMIVANAIPSLHTAVEEWDNHIPRAIPIGIAVLGILLAYRLAKRR